MVKIFSILLHCVNFYGKIVETKCVRGKDMRKMHKILALALGSVMGLAAFAACGSDESANQNYKICYDNLPNDSYTLDSSITSVEVNGVDVVAGYDANGREVENWETIATYEGGTFTGVSAGRVTYRRSDGTLGSVEVVPAYVTDPGNEYAGNATDFLESGTQGESVLGHTHDPSIIETQNWKGEPVYYVFSTGWADQSDYTTTVTAEDGTTSQQTITTYGNAIHVSYDGMKTWEFLGRTFNAANRNAEVVNSSIGTWLYDTLVTDTTATALASWWAPDVVEKPDGSGYWLYTCVVDGGNGVLEEDGLNYARACILLYESETLEPGSFTPVCDENGIPYVLMQSSLNNGPSDPGSVNAIDPQIIYDTEGGMYMAYGSFGSGNYVIELDPETGLRADGQNSWVTHDDLRTRRNEVAASYNASENAIGWENAYYGKNISKAAMEAPVLARHDDVVLMDEDGNELEGSGSTFYYSMHSYDGLSDNYQMWGGRSTTPMGLYTSTQGGMIYNANTGYPAAVSQNTQGNKYMGSFIWTNKAESSPELNAILPGHNDLFTTSDGTSVAAYITRQSGASGNFTSQIHQYYLNSYGDIVINPNRYAGESSRAVTADELFAYTEKSGEAFKFEMIALTNSIRDNNAASGDVIDAGQVTANNNSRTVLLTRNADGVSGNITEADGTTVLGTWKMYGNGYIAFHFTSTLKGRDSSNNAVDTGETTYYGVVSTAWLNDQNKSGFTITCMGRTEDSNTSMAMFMNNYSTISGDGLVGTQYTDAD